MSATTDRAALLVATIALSGIVAFSWSEHRELMMLRAAPKTGEDRRLTDGTTVTPAKQADAATVLLAVEHAGFDVGVLKADLSDHGATLRGVLSATMNTTGNTTTNMPGTVVLGSSTARELPIRETIGDQSIAWGSVVFDATKAVPWTLTQLPRAYTTNVTLAEEDDGGLTAYTRMRIEATGERIDLSPTLAALLVVRPEARWRWDVVPMLALDGGVRDGEAVWLPSVAVAGGTFGVRRDQPTWTLLGLGLGYEVHAQRMAFGILPVAYTLRDWLPVRNASIGVGAFVDVDGRWTYTLGVRSNL